MTEEEREKLIKETRMAVLMDVVGALDQLIGKTDANDERRATAQAIRYFIVERYHAVNGDEADRPHI